MVGSSVRSICMDVESPAYMQSVLVVTANYYWDNTKKCLGARPRKLFVYKYTMVFVLSQDIKLGG